MLFYLISIQKIGETSTQSIFMYTTKEGALSAYHSTLASNYVSEQLDEFCTMIVNAHGGTEIKEYWVKPIIETIDI